MGNRETGSVCIVDDDASVVRATGRLFESAGWSVQTFSDPLAFLEQVQTLQPEVAVLDVRMQPISGLEVQKRLKEVAPDIQVVVVSSNDEPAVRASALAEG